ncbi:MAG: hypothetical protein ACK5L5_12120 [Bacteroidales bacterium]
MHWNVVASASSSIKQGFWRTKRSTATVSKTKASEAFVLKKLEYVAGKLMHILGKKTRHIINILKIISNAMKNANNTSKGFGMSAVFVTAICTILGAILFLRFGYAVGTVSVWGTLLIIFIGHLVTIPTALSISEIATNRRVEGGGIYYVLSRSFGLNIGASIGIMLYLSEAISVAFYVIAFTEAFSPLFDWLLNTYELNLPRQAISIPVFLLMAFIAIKKGANMGMSVLYAISIVLAITILLFLFGKGEGGASSLPPIRLEAFDNIFVVFAIAFPAFTGVTGGVGLSGDLRNPEKAIPWGTTLAAFVGLIVYILVTFKLYFNASHDELLNNQLVMGNIAIGGEIVVLIGLGVSTISSALGSIMVAPRTLQALGKDKSVGSTKISNFIAKERIKDKEPINAVIITCSLAFIFILLGDVDSVAQIITMFFLITYGSVNLISFLNHFGAAPSYRPRFKSTWHISLLGFLVSFWVMFKLSAMYAISACVFVWLIHYVISIYHKDRRGMADLFKSAFFQLNRQLQVKIQHHRNTGSKNDWRPSVICMSPNTFSLNKPMQLVDWVSCKYGFGSYIHYINDIFSSKSKHEADMILKNMLLMQKKKYTHLHIDTMIAPSYTSAIAQVIQMTGISGMNNNMFLLEIAKNKELVDAIPSSLEGIVKDLDLIKVAELDIAIFLHSKDDLIPNFIDIWLDASSESNANLMIMMAYIISSHPRWKKAQLRIFQIYNAEDGGIKEIENLKSLVQKGRIAISLKNIKLVSNANGKSDIETISQYSGQSALAILGISDVAMLDNFEQSINKYKALNPDILLINSSRDTVLDT